MTAQFNVLDFNFYNLPQMGNVNSRVKQGESCPAELMAAHLRLTAWRPAVKSPSRRLMGITPPLEDWHHFFASIMIDRDDELPFIYYQIIAPYVNFDTMA